MKKTELVKRVIALHIDFVSILLQLAVYAYGWFRYYHPVLHARRYTQQGFYIGEGLRLYVRGHILVLAVYFILLMFFTQTYGSRKGGYQKPFSVFLSDIFALLMVNVVTYFQLSLMQNWLVGIGPMALITLVQLAAAFVWAFVADRFYTAAFPARKLLLVSGDYPAEEIIRKFESRKDRYIIEKQVNIADGEEAVRAAIDEGFGGVVLWDIPTAVRNELLKYCYEKAVRAYVMPKIPDVLVKGAEETHLFDTPIYMVKDYAIRVDERCIKRLIDVICALVLVVLTSPVMLVTAIVIRMSDGGPVLYRQTRCTINRKEFQIMKFRSMRVDAERDGVARLATKEDTRITPFGRFIRACRIDELPQLFNILKGDMSFIGPRPERPEIIAQYLESMPEFQYRMRVKAGLAGYAQVYGKYNTTPYDKLKLDLTYIENYSVWLDLKLMLLTLKILFTPDATEGVEETQITALKQTAESPETGERLTDG